MSINIIEAHQTQWPPGDYTVRFSATIDAGAGAITQSVDVTFTLGCVLGDAELDLTIAQDAPFDDYVYRDYAIGWTPPVLTVDPLSGLSTATIVSNDVNCPIVGDVTWTVEFYEGLFSSPCYTQTEEPYGNQQFSGLEGSTSFAAITCADKKATYRYYANFANARTGDRKYFERHINILDGRAAGVVLSSYTQAVTTISFTTIPLSFTAPLFNDAYDTNFELNASKNKVLTGASMNHVITFKVLGHESEPVTNFINIVEMGT